MWRCGNKAKPLRKSLIARRTTPASNWLGRHQCGFFHTGPRRWAPPRGHFHGETAMSNLCDAVGLCIPYGKANSQYETEFEPATGTIWGYFKPRGTACFSLGLLKDIRRHDSALATNGGKVDIGGGEMQTANYYVCASRDPQAFNLGGDLALFVLLIKARDRDALAHYSRLCIDNMYARIQNSQSSTMATISLVQGDALGGGFECAMSSDVIVAEESAQLGLPEILFNLFPGMA